MEKSYKCGSENVEPGRVRHYKAVSDFLHNLRANYLQKPQLSTKPPCGVRFCNEIAEGTPYV